MANNPSIEELDDISRFTRELKLAYEDVAVFVMGRLKNRSTAMIAFWVVTALTVVLNVVLWIKVIRTPAHHSMITGTILGFILLPVALAPLHEAIHYIFLRISGATDIRLGMDLRQGIIYLSAHRHVIGKKSFRIIATSPFIMVNILLAGLIFASASVWLEWVLSAALFMHASMCIGDLVLLGYMEEFKPRQVYTWDDVEAKEAYFYVSQS